MMCECSHCGSPEASPVEVALTTPDDPRNVLEPVLCRACLDVLLDKEWISLA